MFKNERGSTLIVVLLMMLIFTVLGLSIMSASIGGAKRTELRETNIEDNLAAIKHLNEAVAYIRATIEEKYNPDMTMTEYNDDIQQIVDNENYSIEDITTSIDKGKYFTRVLQVTSQNYTQTVYITGMPSFLKYALGSRDNLTLNGSIYLKEGNFYANNGLRISKTANYKYKGNFLEEPTSFPSVLDNKTNLLFLENKESILYCNTDDCYEEKIEEEVEPINSNFHSLNVNNLASVFQPTAPTYTPKKTEFIDVNIPKTFLEKLSDGGFYNGKIETKNLTTDQLIEKVKSVIDNGKNNPEVKKINLITNKLSTDQIEAEKANPENPFKYIEVNDTNDSYLYQTSDPKNRNPAIIDKSLLTINKDKWLVIDGDARFESIGNELMKIKANILVTGNLTIVDNLAFDSTIYVLGETIIDDATITGINDSELILMTEGNLELARFDKFNNNPTPNSIKAYLYTSQDAIVYAVGSRISITGGLFAGGNLAINAFRGEATEGTDKLQFTSSNGVESSRFIINNNKILFTNQTQGLPKVEKLEVLTDLMEQP